jgi:hypothetical protein
MSTTDISGPMEKIFCNFLEMVGLPLCIYNIVKG